MAKRVLIISVVTDNDKTDDDNFADIRSAISIGTCVSNDIELDDAWDWDEDIEAGRG